MRRDKKRENHLEFGTFLRGNAETNKKLRKN